MSGDAVEDVLAPDVDAVVVERKAMGDLRDPKVGPADPGSRRRARVGPEVGAGRASFMDSSCKLVICITIRY